MWGKGEMVCACRWTGVRVRVRSAPRGSKGVFFRKASYGLYPKYFSGLLRVVIAHSCCEVGIYTCIFSRYRRRFCFSTFWHSLSVFARVTEALAFLWSGDSYSVPWDAIPAAAALRAHVVLDLVCVHSNIPHASLVVGRYIPGGGHW